MYARKGYALGRSPSLRFSRTHALFPTGKGKGHGGFPYIVEEVDKTEIPQYHEK